MMTTKGKRMFTDKGYMKQLEEACGQRGVQNWHREASTDTNERRQARALERVADALERLVALSEPKP